MLSSAYTDEELFEPDDSYNSVDQREQVSPPACLSITLNRFKSINKQNTTVRGQRQ